MKKLLSFSDESTEYLHCVEAGETLADVAFTHQVPVKDIINDNALTEEPLAGQYIIIKKRGDVTVLTPEDLAKAQTDDGHYPFEVVPTILP